MDIKTFTDLATSAGTLGVLIWLVFQFRSGEIIPKTTLKQILDVQERGLERQVEATSKRFEEIVAALKDLKEAPIVHCPLVDEEAIIVQQTTRREGENLLRPRPKKYSP